MSTKPTIALARFATGGTAGSPDVVAPPSDLRDTGFQDDTPIEQGFVNELFNQAYKWAQYIDDADLVGDTTIDGALEVGGQPFTLAPTVFTASASTDKLTVTGSNFPTGLGPLQLNSSGTLPTGLVSSTDYWAIADGANTFRLAGSLAAALAGTFIDIDDAGSGTHTIFSTGSTVKRTDATVSRDLTVDGSLSVGAGSLDVTGDMTVGGNETVGGTLGVTGLITAHAGVTCDANQHVTVSGTGKVKHGLRTQVIRTGDATNNVPWLTGSGFDSRCWLLNDYIPTGKRILEIRIYITDSATGPTKAGWEFGTVTPASGTSFTQVGTTGLSAGDGSYQTKSITGLTTTISAGTLYIFRSNTSSGTASVTQWYIEVDYDQP